MFNGGHGKFIGLTEEGKPYFAAKNPEAIGKDTAGNIIYKDAKGSNVKSTNDFLGDRAVEFIQKNKDKSFYYVLSIPDPHTPDYASGPYHDMYKDMDVQFPKTYNAPRPEGTPKWQSPDGKAKNLKTILPQYFGMVKNIDDNVGRIYAALEKEGILENTIIVFTSDHGDLMGEHARMNKGTVHDGATKVGFVIAHGQNCKKPLVPRGKVITQAANTTDWMPTFLSILGVKCPKVPGRDLTPLFAKQAPKTWNDVTFSHLGFVAAIDSQYKLWVSPWKDETWLLDVKADPNELTNFIDDKKYNDVVVRLAKEMLRYNDEYNKSNKALAAKVNALISERQ